MSAKARPRSGESSNRRSWLVITTLVAAVCTALALGGCAKGRNDTSTTATKATAAPAGIPVYQVSVSKFTYQGMPDTVPAGKPFTIAFTNKESFEITHEMVVVALPSRQDPRRPGRRRQGQRTRQRGRLAALRRDR